MNGNGPGLAAAAAAAECKVTEVADRNAGIVLKINKERLQGLN